MAKKNNRRTIITKRILKDSLLELMQQKSISRITIREICDLSDMSRSTFYLHYQDQYKLLEDIEKEVLEKTFENLRELNSELTAVESIAVFLSYVKENKTTFGVLLCQPENQAFQKAIMDRVQAYIQSIVPSRNTSDKDLLLYSFIMHGSLSVLTGWINSRFRLPEGEVAKIIYHACDRVVKS